jgi:Ca2+-binding RTX toxin-like protein
MVLKETNLLDPQFIAELYTDFTKNPEALTSPYLDFLFNNVILGTKGNDTLNGSGVKDIIYGQEGDDILYGNGGDDTLIGGTGNDKLYGGDGNDVLIGGPGNDYLEGGRGNDTYIFNKGDGQDTIVNDKYWDGYWNGLGTLKFGGGITKDDVEFTKDGDDLVVIIKGTDDSIRVKNWFYRNWFRLDKVEFADGTKLTINDIEQIGYKIYGTSGNDTLNGSGVKDIIYGQEGDDILYGNGGDDTLIGGTGNDKLYGGDGNDVLIGGPGNDYLEGGRGNDTYIFNKGDGQDTIYDYKWNSTDVDTIQLDEGITKDGIVFFKDNNDLIIGYSNNDFVKVLYQFKGKNYGIEKIEVKDGYYITRLDIENIVNAMIDFTNDKGMSYTEMYNNLLNNQNYTILLSQSWKQLNYSGGIT